MKENLLLLKDLLEPQKNKNKKIYEYMTLVSKNKYIDKLNDIINERNNTYRSTIKMKSADVKSNTHINSSKEINDEDPKFKIGDANRISKYKNLFAKGYVPNLSEKFLLLQKFKILFRGHVICNLNREEIVGMFYEKEL